MRERGLPQGLASSVILSELFLSVLLRRLHACVDIDSVCYMDDLTLVADTQEKLVDAMRILWDFSFDFSLDISGDKSFLWGSRPDRLQVIAAQWGIGVRDSLCALGMEWAISKHVTPEYAKERSRMREVEERLERACHIPSPIVVKTQLIAMGCLSPLAFSPCPDLDALKPIARKVKVALGHSFAAPEALFAILEGSWMSSVYGS